MALQVAQSVMSPNPPMVAAGYGDSNWLTSQGAGGLSGAMPDLARLVAIFIDQHDNPALKRSTITSMLNRAAAAFTEFGNNRAGYGLDQVATQSGGFYYGQKGGEMINAAGVLQFNGDWGFALCFGSPAQIPRYEAGLVSRLHTDDEHRHERVLVLDRPVPAVRDGVPLAAVPPTTPSSQ